MTFWLLATLIGVCLSAFMFWRGRRYEQDRRGGYLIPPARASFEPWAFPPLPKVYDQAVEREGA